MNNSNQIWRCNCGTLNDTELCTKCGAARPYSTPAPQYKQSAPIVQSVQPMGTAELVKRMAGSWWVLVLAIASTVIALLTTIAILSNLKIGLSLIIDLGRIALAIILAVGFWTVWTKGRNKNEHRLNPSGLNMIKGVVNTYATVYIGLLSLITLGIILILAFAQSAGDTVDRMLDFGGELNSFVGSVITVVVLVIAAAFVVLIMYFKSITTLINDVRQRAEGSRLNPRRFLLAAIMLIIMGLGNLLSFYAKQAANQIVDTLVQDSGLDEIMNFSLFSDSIWTTIQSICKILLYLFGGVVIIIYGNALNAKKPNGAENNI